MHRSLVVIVHTSRQRRGDVTTRGSRASQPAPWSENHNNSSSKEKKDFFVELSNNKCDLGIVIAKAKKERNGILGSHTKAFANWNLYSAQTSSHWNASQKTTFPFPTWCYLGGKDYYKFCSLFNKIEKTSIGWIHVKNDLCCNCHVLIIYKHYEALRLGGWWCGGEIWRCWYVICNMCRHVDKLDSQKDYSVPRSFCQPTSRYIATIATMMMFQFLLQIAGFQHIFKRKMVHKKENSWT